MEGLAEPTDRAGATIQPKDADRQRGCQPDQQYLAQLYGEYRNRILVAASSPPLVRWPGGRWIQCAQAAAAAGMTGHILSAAQAERGGDFYGPKPDRPMLLARHRGNQLEVVAVRSGRVETVPPPMS